MVAVTDFGSEHSAVIVGSDERDHTTVIHAAGIVGSGRENRLAVDSGRQHRAIINR